MTIINTSPDRPIQLGYEGEDRVTVLRFRYGADWLENGEGVFHIRVRRHGENQAYNAQLVADDAENNCLLMTVTNVELSVKGSGEMQVVYSGENFVKKSPIYSYNVSRAVDEVSDPPAEDVYTQIIESLSDLQTDVQGLSDAVDGIGNLADLTTTAKNDLVSAINEVNEHGGGGGSVTVDDALSNVSENPVQNKVVTSAIQSKADTATVSALADAVNGLDSDVQDLQTGKADTSTVTALSGTVSGLQTAVQSKADAQTVTALSGTVTGLQTSKADKSYVDTQLAEKASTQTVSDLSDDVSDLQTGLAGKVEIPHTDEAKIAIQKMLGIYEAPWELINEETFTNAEEADYIITTDSNGNAFELTDIRIIFWLPEQNNVASKKDYGRISFFDDNSLAYQFAYLGEWTQKANASARGGWAELLQDNGMLSLYYTTNAADSSNTNTIKSVYRRQNQWNQFIFVPDTKYCSKIVITKVTGTGHYRLYGKRKWT